MVNTCKKVRERDEEKERKDIEKNCLLGIIFLSTNLTWITDTDHDRNVRRWFES